MTIKFYKTNDPFGFLNNFKKSPFTLYDRVWKNVESAYQAQKTLVPEEYEAIHSAVTPREAMNLGRACTVRPDWEDMKFRIMKECVYAKFSQNQDLQDQLLATGEEELVEDSAVDWCWGCGADGTGKNMLGKTLMEVREILKNESK